MYFRDSEHENLAQRIIQKWYLPTNDDDGNPVQRTLAYSKRKKGTLERITFPVVGFLSKDEHTALDEKKMMEWFAILDNLWFFSKRYPKLRFYFDTFWTNLKDLFDFDLSIDSLIESQDVLNRINQTTESFFPVTEKYFKGLMNLLGKRDEVVANVESIGLGMSTLINHFNPMFGGSKYLPIYTTIVCYRNWVHGDSRKEIPENEKLVIPLINKGYTIRGSKEQENARLYRNIVRLVVAGFLRIIMLHQTEMEKELGKLMVEEEITEPVPQGTIVDVEPILARYIKRLETEAVDGFKEEARKIGGQSEEIINMGTTLILSDWQDVNQREVTSVPIESLPEYKGSRVCFLLGSPGAGKTTAISQIVRLTSRMWEDSSKSVLPVRVSLNGCGGPNGDPYFLILHGFLDQLTDFSPAERAAVIDLFEQMTIQGRLILLLDGLNELQPGSEPFLQLLAKLLPQEGKFGKCRVFLTDRIYEFQYHQEFFEKAIRSDVAVFHMAQISKGLIVEHLKKLEIPPEDLSRFLAMIENERVGALLGVPLNFMMLMQVVKASTILSKEEDEVLKTRGELLEKFMRAIINDTQKVLQKNFVANDVFDQLQSLALLHFEGDKKSIAKSELSTDIPSEFFAKNILNLHEGDDPRISFVYDTYREYFMGRYLASQAINVDVKVRQQFVQKWLTPPILKNPNHVETFKLALEVLLSRNETGENAAEWLVETIYNKGRQETRILSESTLLPPANHQINGMMVFLCKMVMDVPPRSKPFMRVSEWVLNEMMLYRLNHPVPTTELIRSQKRRLSQAVSCAAGLNSGIVNKELFNIYWMAMLGIADRGEFGFYIGNAIPKSALLENISSDVRNVFDSLFHQYEVFRVGGLSGSQSLIFKFILVLFNMLVDSPYTAELLYNHIEKLRTSNPDEDNELLLFSSSLAFYYGDLETLSERAHLDLLEEKGIHLGWQQLNSLLRIVGGQSISAMELVLSDKFIGILTYPKEMIMVALKVFLNRSVEEVPTPVRHFLFDNTRKAISCLGEENYAALLDLIPLSQIPESIRNCFFNPSISAYLMSHSRGEELQHKPIAPDFEEGHRYLAECRFYSICTFERQHLTTYQIYNKRESVVVLITQKVEETVPCWVRLGRKIYPVLSIDTLSDVVELEFETEIAVTLPNGGLIFSEEGDKIPYFRVTQSRKCHRVLLEKSWFEERLHDEKEKSQVKAQYYYWKHYRLKLKTIRLLPTKNLFSLWTLEAKSDAGIFEQGFFQIDKQPSFENNRPAERSPFTRFYGSLQELSVIAARDFIFYLFSPKSSDSFIPGVWARLEEGSSYLPISAPARRISWTMELSFSCVRKLAPSGSFTLQGMTGAMLFRSKSFDGKGGHVWEVYPLDATLSAAEFLHHWAEADNIHVQSSSLDVNEDVRVRQKGPYELFQGDFSLIPIVSESWDDKWLSSPVADLAVPHPCRMPIPRDDDGENGIQLHHVYYRSTLEPGVIKIVSPETLDKNLWISLDGGPRFQMGTPEVRKEGGVSYRYIRVCMKDGTIPRIRQFGQLRLFKNAAGDQASIEYNTLLKSIALALPWPNSVHASICPMLIKELLNIRIMNPEILSFFENKSAVHFILEQDALANQVYKLESQRPLLNICYVHPKVRNRVFNVYSSKWGMALTPIPPSGTEPCKYVLCEKDNRSYAIETPPRLPICGFMEGVITTRNKSDAFVASESGDYYCPRCSLEKGTLISFFPDINSNYSRNAMNRHGAEVNSKLASDIQVIGVIPWADCEVKSFRENSTEKGGRWVEILLRGLSGDLSGRTTKLSMSLDRIPESKREVFREGYVVQALEYAGKWYLNL